MSDKKDFSATFLLFQPLGRLRRILQQHWQFATRMTTAKKKHKTAWRKGKSKATFTARFTIRIPKSVDKELRSLPLYERRAMSSMVRDALVTALRRWRELNSPVKHTS